jgi:2-dehydro-3-deoxygluconokinase
MSELRSDVLRPVELSTRRPVAADGADRYARAGVPEALDVLCLGEALWDLTAPRGRTFAEARSLRLDPGGAAVNVAMGLSRRGFRAGLVATVGADAMGEALAARVAATGVSTALVQRAPPRTGLVLAERAGPSSRIVGYRSAGEAPPELPATWSARALLVTGLLPSAEQARSFGAAAGEARRRGVWVAVDLNARPRLWSGRAAEPPPAWLEDADLIKASEDDLAAMGLDEDALRRVMRPSAVLVVTAGPRTARATGGFGVVRREPASIARGSALGAGDAFTVGILETVLRGAGTDAAFWEGALRRGHALARRRVTPG